MKTSADYQNRKNESTALDILAFKWLSLNKNINYIYKVAHNLLKIESAISDLLPKHLEITYKVIKIEQNTLLIAVPNSANATRIKYLSKEIIKHLQKSIILEIKEIKLKIHTNYFNNLYKRTEESNKKFLLNKDNISHFEKLNREIKDGPLKISISKLIENNS